MDIGVDVEMVVDDAVAGQQGVGAVEVGVGLGVDSGIGALPRQLILDDGVVDVGLVGYE